MGEIEYNSGYILLFSPNRTEFEVCPNKTSSVPDILVPDKNPDATTITLPMLYRQILMMMVATGFLQLLFKPLYQQRLTAAIIAGILVGPTALSQIDKFMKATVPFKSIPTLTIYKNLGIMFYMFLVGLEMNLTPIVRIDGRTLRVAVAGIVVPFAFGFGSYFIFYLDSITKNKLNVDFDLKVYLKSAFPWAIAMTCTNLPNLAKTLSDLKLMRTDIGRMAISSALYNDIAAWLFLLILITFTHDQPLLIAISAVVFLLACVFWVRPVLSYIVSRATISGLDRDHHIHFVVFGVMVFALVSDSLGLTSTVGAFVFGFILPSGRLTTRVTDQLGAITNWIWLPLYCLDNGTKTNLFDLVTMDRINLWYAAGFVAMCWMAKFVGTIMVTYQYKMEMRQAISLAVLMNSKGLLPIFIINFAKDFYLLGITESTCMVVAILVMMITVPIIVKLVYKPPRRELSHGSRTIESIRSDWPFRILFGIHSISNVQPIMDVVQISNPTLRSPINVMVLHLVELTDRTSAAAMLFMHDNYGSSTKKSAQANAMAELEQIMEDMEDYGRLNKDYVSVECLTTLSPYRTMHADICSVVDDKYATVVILPFDLKGENGENEIGNYTGIRNMTHNLLESAPCTVGLLINRGFGMSFASPANPNSVSRALILFFIGGSDDREALTYAWRMSWNPQVHLTVVRFIQGNDLADLANSTVGDGNGNRGISNKDEHERQKDADKDFMGNFKSQTMGNPSVRYIEEVSNDGEETITIIRDIMAKEMYELCIVGRGHENMSPLISGLLDLVEYQELGVIADAIVTSHFSDNSSVLVIQHYVDKSD